MKNLAELSAEFTSKYEDFLIGCEAYSGQGKWNEEYGNMSAFYQHDLLSVIIRLMAVDEVIHQREVDCLNKSFGFDYSRKEMVEVYKECCDDVGHSFDKQFKQGVSLIQSIDAKLAESYKEILRLICDIMILSDNLITPEEKEEAKSLKALVS